jgi:hypothetical protein
MGEGVGGCPSGSSSRRGGPVGHRRWRRWPTLARTRRPAGAARCTSAACRTGCPRRGYARSPSGVPPGSVLAARGWRAGRPGHARSGPGGRAGSRRRRPGARLAGRAAARPPPGRPGWPPAAVACAGWLGPAGRPGDAACLDGDRGLQPLLRRSTGLGPAVWPPQGALGGAAVHGQLLQLQAEQLVIGGQHLQAESFGHPGADPLLPSAPQGGRRAGVVGDAPVATAEHQHLDELVEHDPGQRCGAGGSRAGGRPGGWAAARTPGPTGVPGPTMAGQARDLPMTAGCETSAIITARACPAPPRLLAQALSGGCLTGPNPATAFKSGSNYHLLVERLGIPLAGPRAWTRPAARRTQAAVRRRPAHWPQPAVGVARNLAADGCRITAG